MAPSATRPGPHRPPPDDRRRPLSLCPGRCQLRPHNIRTRARVRELQSHQQSGPSRGSKSNGIIKEKYLFTAERLPYVQHGDRQLVIRGQSKLLKPVPGDTAEPRLYHVDFLPTEAAEVRKVACSVLGISEDGKKTGAYGGLAKPLRNQARDSH